MKHWKKHYVIYVFAHSLCNIGFGSLQIHLYNQAVVSSLQATNGYLVLDRVDGNENNPALLGPLRPAVNKLPFNLNDVPYFNTTFMCDPMNQTNMLDDDSDAEVWDAPLKRATNVSSRMIACTTQNAESYVQSSYVTKDARVTFSQCAIKWVIDFIDIVW